MHKSFRTNDLNDIARNSLEEIQIVHDNKQIQEYQENAQFKFKISSWFNDFFKWDN